MIVPGVSAGSRNVRTVLAGTYLSRTEVSAGSKKLRTVSAEAIYDRESRQEVKTVDYFIPCDVKMS